jgi:hypothetical protein
MALVPWVRLTFGRLFAITTVLAISACGGGAPTEAVAADVPAGDGPCGLLKLAEVRHALPEVQKAERDRSVDQHGIFSCAWRTGTGGRALIVQRWEGSDSADVEIRGQMIGMVDPLKPQAGKALRYETISGVGDEARAVVERRDDARGILSDFGCLFTKRGDHGLSLCSQDIAKLERPQALKALQDLARAAAGRME